MFPGPVLDWHQPLPRSHPMRRVLLSSPFHRAGHGVTKGLSDSPRCSNIPEEGQQNCPLSPEVDPHSHPGTFCWRWCGGGSRVCHEG